ncbi:acetolactate synthase AlsS [Yokenella regensburgei]|jgi:acetolactate synthase-1/2/3 large subunit|uniref:acetolactate synthase AlsS n=1 Tax=Yokenella regensburgei TaxID=158877 RepID=UPI00289F8D78|nr:acetolactate synthase AlsS [Yokenella regensburgei]
MTPSSDRKQWTSGADLVVAQLEAQGVRHVFGIPGAKIDKVFDSLLDSSIQTIPVRHEANAAFMAAAVGRLSGRAGVALVTSGPGCSNLVTGMATATSEGDPVVAIGGAVKRADSNRLVHQNMDTVAMFRPVTKYAVEVNDPLTVTECLSNAFRHAEHGRGGGAFISLPQDIINQPVSGRTISHKGPVILGSAPEVMIDAVACRISKARNPLILLGMMASQPANSEAVNDLLARSHIPVTSTYQAAGSIRQEHFPRFAGRVGLFNNQPGDRLLEQADLIITIGYSPVEYEPSMWNKGRADLVHIDVMPAAADSCYVPDTELIGNIASTVKKLATRIFSPKGLSEETAAVLDDRQQQRRLLALQGANMSGFALHPLRVVRAMQDIINSDVSLTVDMGSFHIWIARYLYSFRARQILISNGQQTMGVALPWAIGAWLVDPQRKVISVSGDGGFLQSSMELETAVRLKANIMHIVWVDNAYNMVAMQEEKKYQRVSGVKFGPIDFKAYAEAIGAAGFAVRNASELESTLRHAMNTQGPSVVAIPVDYTDNHLLMSTLHLSTVLTGSHTGSNVGIH